MPNANYVKGRKKEYKICEQLKKKGFDIVQRTAGSHSPFDVIGIDIKNKKIRLVQSKPNTMNSHQQQKLREKNKDLNGLFEVKFSVV